VFQSVGHELPAHIAPDELTLKIQSEALRACQGGAIYPGAREALQDLHQAGVRLHMASSHESRYLMAAMHGAGLDTLLDSFFGADLIDCAKEGTEYYCRMFESCGIRPEQAVVLDDGVDCLKWAQESGARVIQVRLRQDPPAQEFDSVLTDWRALPPMMAALANTQYEIPSTQ
jgi:phosphoglycolate phosphatase